MPHTPSFSASPCGRLVLILETELQPQSRTALRALIRQFHATAEPTFLASLAKPSRLAALKADAGSIFYNTTDDLSLPETLALLPWKEIWLLANGHLWQQKWQEMPSA